MSDTWIPISRGAEGLEVLEDGTIKLSALRAQGLTYILTPDPDHPGHFLSAKHRKIRLSVAIPMDHRVRGGFKLSCDPSALPTGAGDQADTEHMESGVIRQHYAQAGHTYQRWLRKNSFPKPESVVSATTRAHAAAAEDKLGKSGDPKDTLRDDTQYLLAQARRRLCEVGRLNGERPIFLKGICLGYKPGDQIYAIGDQVVKKVVKDVILHVGNETQITELILG